MGQTMNLQELQKKMESQQATLAQLLRVIRPKHSVTGDMSLPPALGPRAPYGMVESSLSVMKGWDPPREGFGGGPGSRVKRRGGKNHGGGGGGGGNRSHQMMKKERYLAVEGFWKSMASDRKSVLEVPVKKVLEVAKSFEESGVQHGTADDVILALRILKKNGSQHACYWRCPCCSIHTYDALGFLDHMATHHETVQYACEDTPLLCSTCAQEIVGAFYYAGEISEPSAVRCMRCAWESSPPAAPANIPQGWSLHVPRDIMVENSWSDSLCSLNDRGDDDFSDDSEFVLSEESASNENFRLLLETASFTEDSLSTDEELEEICTCHNHASSIDALVARIRDGEDGLLSAIAGGIQYLAQHGQDAQFEAAITSVVQQTQRMMHGALTSLVSAVENGKNSAIPGGSSAERKEAASRLQDPKKFPEQALEIRNALTLLNPSELQDLLALMARKYSPQSQYNQYHLNRRSDGESISDTESKGSSIDSQYEPMCVSVLKIEEIGANDKIQPRVEEPDDSDDERDSLPEISDTEIVRAQPWWIEHLVQKSWQDFSNKEDSYLLQWIFGNVAHGTTYEFLERQRMACGGKSIEKTIMGAYSEIAETWRHLAATMDRKRHISTLRDAVAEDLEAAASFDRNMTTSLRKQAEQFHEEVMKDPVLSAVCLGQAEMDAAWSQKALQNLQRFHQLKDETSIRYAQALIDREIAVLELADVMDQHECDVAERELSTVDAGLGTAQRDLAEAEAELARAQVEGPALHRKRDVLDRVNKEAEYRERLQELQQHIASCKERIVSEEAFGAGAQKRREQAVTDLHEVRNVVVMNFEEL